MSRLELQKYLDHIFGSEKNTNRFYKINAAHIINSNGYDVQFGRFGLLYRDADNNVRFSIEHDTRHIVTVYASSFLEDKSKQPVGLSKKELIERITLALNFLNVKSAIE